MATYRKVLVLSRKEAAYIARLIDGEGTISLSPKHANDPRQLGHRDKHMREIEPITSTTQFKISID